MMGEMAEPETIVLLHGFAGTGRAWDQVVAGLDAERYRALAPDLRAHGSAADRRPVSFAACVDDVLAAAPPRFALGGYSQGGRIALHVALAAPERIDRLVLVATTAGIEDDEARAARRASDARLAAWLEQHTIEEFSERWAAQPLFADDPREVAAAAREDQLRNERHALAAALRGIGTGEMLPLWDRLHELTMPATVVVGERDAKFRAIGGRLVDRLPDARLVIVPGAGHGLPREAPEALAQALAGGPQGG
jgi:2-succinyl-6-hydroxy-2,4-cyclohexadiene-1-carboxylate synthase